MYLYLYIPVRTAQTTYRFILSVKFLDLTGVLTIGTVRTDLFTNDQTGDLGIGKRIIPVVGAYDHPDEHGTTPGEIALKNTKNTTYKNPVLFRTAMLKPTEQFFCQFMLS